MDLVGHFRADRGITVWRHDLHRHPELLYDVHRTARLVADNLRLMGCDEVVEGIGRTGVVGVVKGRETRSGTVIGLRADMDALPIEELNTFGHVSTVPGRMHACGHDGHTAMLLGVARRLASERDFDGVVALVFQPAEEGGAGGEAMVRDGLMERFGIRRIYGLHNMPGMPVGTFGIRPRTIMASADFFDITVAGKGGHAAYPHLCDDPMFAAAQVVCALQSIPSRVVAPLDSAVVTVTKFEGGHTHNVVPDTVTLGGTARTLKEGTRDRVEATIARVCEQVGKAHGVEVRLDYRRLYPVTDNDPEATRIAARAARGVVGEANVDDDILPSMGAEDFAFMLNVRGGAFIFMGNGDTAGLHSSHYDFNDEASPYGCAYWARLVGDELPLGA